MKGDYPRFKASYSHEELVEHFLLTTAEHALVSDCRGDVNRHGAAVLLKSLFYLGYFPNQLSSVPDEIKNFIATQLGLLWEPNIDYPTDERTQRNHIAMIRGYAGWRFTATQDKRELEQWLREEGAKTVYTKDNQAICYGGRNGKESLILIC